MPRDESRHMLMTALTAMTTDAGAIIGAIDTKKDPDEMRRRCNVAIESARRYIWIVEQVAKEKAN